MESAFIRRRLIVIIAALIGMSTGKFGQIPRAVMGNPRAAELFQCRAHAPNENIRIDLYLQHARHMARVVREFGK